jgi:NAD dependent epimerase/dehydratase family enzyme
MLHLASVLIGTESELLLKSRWVIPRRLQNEGFTFRYATLSDALKNLAHHDIQPVSAVRLETAL